MRKIKNVILVAQLMSLFIAQAAAEDSEQLYLDIYINERLVQEMYAIERRGDAFYATLQSTSWLPQLDNRTPIGQPVNLCQIAQAQCRFERSTLRLYVDFPASAFNSQRFSYGYREIPEINRLSATLVNYDAYYAALPSGESYLDVVHQARHSGKFGIFETNGVYRQPLEQSHMNDDKSSEYVRFESSWQYNDEKRMRSYRIGDFVTAPSQVGRQARMAGVQISTDFTLDPSFVSYPFPEFVGEAVLPSAIDIFVNNSRQFSGAIEPGPYIVDSGSALVGLNEATILTRDIRGNLTSRSLSFYFTPNLLRQGVSSYSAQFGYLRNDFGLASNEYDDRLTSVGDFAYGLNNSNTLAARIEYSSLLKNLGVEWRASLATYGVVSLAAAYGQSGEQSGFLWKAGYRYTNRKWGMLFEHTQRETDYSDLATISNSQRYRSESRANFSYGLDRGQIGIGYFSIKPVGRPRERLLSGFASRTLGNFNLSLSTSYDFESKGKSINLYLSLPFGNRGRASVRHSKANSSNANTVATYTSSRGLEQNFNYGVAYGLQSKNYTANATYRSQFAELSAGQSRTAIGKTTWGRLNGSMVWVDSEFFFTNRITDSFVLVDTDGFADIPVRKENQLIGTTNKNGRLLVAGVNSYNTARFSLDAETLPINTRITSNRASTAAARKIGAKVAFQIGYSNAALVILTDGEQPLSLGSRARLNGAADELVIGWDGEVYIENLASSNTLEVTTVSGKRCHIEFDFEAKPDVIPVLGPFLCKEESPQ